MTQARYFFNDNLAAEREQLKYMEQHPYDYCPFLGPAGNENFLEEVRQHVAKLEEISKHEDLVHEWWERIPQEVRESLLNA